MSKLELRAAEGDKPMKLTIEMPVRVHRNVVTYAEAIG